MRERILFMERNYHDTRGIFMAFLHGLMNFMELTNYFVASNSNKRHFCDRALEKNSIKKIPFYCRLSLSMRVGVIDEWQRHKNAIEAFSWEEAAERRNWLFLSHYVVRYHRISTHSLVTQLPAPLDMNEQICVWTYGAF